MLFRLPYIINKKKKHKKTLWFCMKIFLDMFVINIVIFTPNKKISILRNMALGYYVA